MVDNIKITALTAIGANIAYTTLVPVVNMTGTPLTQKATAQDLGNLILSGAGGSYFARAAQSNLALSVANAAQPNITSVGSLTSLTVTGNITTGNINGGNIVVANFYSGDGGFLTNVYSNSSVANYLPTYTGNLTAGNLNVTGNVSVGNIIGNGQALTGIAGANVSGFVPNANVANTAFAVAGANVTGTVPSATTAGTVTTAAQPNITSVGTLTGLGINGNITAANITANTGIFTGNGSGLSAIAGANVSGFVPNANVANTAFAVAAANVSGLGNIATINLDGSNSNILYGNGTFAPVAGGANIGNVTFNNVTVQGVNGLNLSADSNFTANLAYLRVRAGDVPSHIHLDTGNNQAYDLIVGDDQKFVQVSSTGNILMSSYDNNVSYEWNFDNNGNLALPQGGTITDNIPPVTFNILFQYDDLVWSGNTLTFTNASSTYMLGVLALMEVGDAIILGSTPATVTGVYTGGGAGTFTVNGTGVGQQIAQFTLPNRLTSVNGIKLTTNAKNYLFTEAGVTQSPVLTVDTLPSGQFAVAGFRAFVSDANLVPTGNFGAIVGNSGSNTVCVWCDGTNWRIG
jgi:hypothetical protein